MKRYDVEYTRQYTEHREMVEREHGDYVRWDDVAPLIEALRGLVKANDDWNAAMMTVIGRPPQTGRDAYLTAARAALASVGEAP